MNSERFLVEYRLSGHFFLDTGLSKPGVFILRGFMHFPALPVIGMRYFGPVLNHNAHVTEVNLMDARKRGPDAIAFVSYQIKFAGIEFNLGELEGQFPDVGPTQFAEIFRWLLTDRKLTLYQMPGVDVHSSMPITTFDQFLGVCDEGWYNRVFELLVNPEGARPPESP